MDDGEPMVSVPPEMMFRMETLPPGEENVPVESVMLFDPPKLLAWLLLKVTVDEIVRPAALVAKMPSMM